MTDRQKHLEYEIQHERQRIAVYAGSTLGQLAGCTGDCGCCERFTVSCETAQHVLDLYEELNDLLEMTDLYAEFTVFEE